MMYALTLQIVFGVLGVIADQSGCRVSSILFDLSMTCYGWILGYSHYKKVTAEELKDEEKRREQQTDR